VEGQRYWEREGEENTGGRGGNQLGRGWGKEGKVLKRERG